MNQQAIDSIKAERDAAVRERDAWQALQENTAELSAKMQAERDAMAQEVGRLREALAVLLANPTSELMKNIARAALKETK